MKIHINIEKDIDTCVHCPFWAMDAAHGIRGIQYCHYNERDLDTSKTSHPPVPDWCPFIKDDPVTNTYNEFCNKFPDLAAKIVKWHGIGDNTLSIVFREDDGALVERIYRRWPDNRYILIDPFVYPWPEEKQEDKT